ncbi:MAG: patatin-like phospholipase family protein [Deltaproteobacteria bacterium]|nr:patatin-like phospholipase family protein [Deltaproteobacteria bacterium]
MTGHSPKQHHGGKTAVVLSGGGANGAYEVGILKALFSGQSPTTGYLPLEPDIFVGTSIGGFNAAFLTSQWDDYGSASVSNLESFWLDQIAGPWHDNGVFRIRGNPLEVMRPKYLFSDPGQRLRDWVRDAGTLAWDGVQRGVHFATAREETIEQRAVEMANLSSFISTEPMARMLMNLDYEAIRRSSRWLKVAATNWATGELRIFWNHDMTDSFGPLAVRASASIPGIFPPVEYGSQPLCDGSVLLNTPLSPAIHAGAETLHLVYLDPDIKNIPLAHMQNSYDSFLRMMQITWAAAYNDDIGDASRINRGLEAVEKIRHGEGSPSAEAKAFLESGGGRIGRKLKPLTIYRYHPRDPLEGSLGFLNFSRDRVEALIERGFQDAIQHDSIESEDVIPRGVEIPVNSRFKRSNSVRGGTE